MLFFFLFLLQHKVLDVDRPSTRDVEAWGLAGTRASSVSMVIRWVLDRKIKDERVAAENLHPSRLGLPLLTSREPFTWDLHYVNKCMYYSSL